MSIEWHMVGQPSSMSRYRVLCLIFTFTSNRNSAGSKCDSLASPTNVNVSTQNLHTIVISTYSCKSGYRLKNGGSPRFCLPNGLWSGKELSCERKYMQSVIRTWALIICTFEAECLLMVHIEC